MNQICASKEPVISTEYSSTISENNHNIVKLNKAIKVDNILTSSKSYSNANNIKCSRLNHGNTFAANSFQSYKVSKTFI